MPITADLTTKSQAEIRGTKHVAIKAQPKEDKILRVACYCRTSSDMQESSVQQQEVNLRHMVEHTPNWTLVDVYVDDGI